MQLCVEYGTRSTCSLSKVRHMSNSPKKEKIKRYFVEYTLWIPHTSEIEIVPVDSRDSESAVAMAIQNAPNNAYSFRFYEQTETISTINGELVAEMSEPKKFSGQHYIGGVLLDQSDLNQPDTQQAINEAGLKRYYMPGELIRTRFRTIVPFNSQRDKTYPDR